MDTRDENLVVSGVELGPTTVLHQVFQCSSGRTLRLTGRSEKVTCWSVRRLPALPLTAPGPLARREDAGEPSASPNQPASAGGMPSSDLKVPCNQYGRPIHAISTIQCQLQHS